MFLQDLKVSLEHIFTVCGVDLRGNSVWYSDLLIYYVTCLGFLFTELDLCIYYRDDE